jgi:hypothetical protein
MPGSAFRFLALLMFLAQSPVPTLPRIGDVARQLTEQDIEALQMVLPPGSRPWLLNGDPGQIMGNQSIYAYLSPTTTSPALRRGPVVPVSRNVRYSRVNNGVVLVSPPTSWTVRPALEYAQVAISGRDFDMIQGDQDINRPFLVDRRLGDAELIRLVEFLRSKAVPTGRSSDTIRSWPILGVARQSDDSVRVSLRGAVMSGQEIVLRQTGQDWFVVSVGMWIA